tara:strand:+ start:73 stop:825 length:753 start_codon:yes stop_codon:yes gene_type:complete
MAIFSNSSSQQHSILAGYQRRANHLKARSTSRYNVGVNLGSLRDEINDRYNSRFTKPYGNPQDLQRKVQKWVQHETKNVQSANRRLKAASANLAKLVENQKTIAQAHADITVETAKAAAGRIDEVDANKIAEKTAIVKAIDNQYRVNNYVDIMKKQSDAIEVARKKKAAAEATQDTVTDVTDKVYMKDVEDFMVDGRLMRESKFAIMGIPATVGLTMLAAGVIYFGFLQPNKPKRKTVHGNKSAAVAVFG